MKFDHAWTLAGQPRDGTPAPPPGKRTPVLPRLPACRALFRQTGKRIFRAMLAVFRTGRRRHLAFGEHALGPGVPPLAARPRRHNRRPSYPPPSHKTGLGNICIGQRFSHGARRLACGGRIGPPHRNRLVFARWALQKLVRISRTAGCDPTETKPLPGGFAGTSFGRHPASFSTRGSGQGSASRQKFELRILRTITESRSATV